MELLLVNYKNIHSAMLKDCADKQKFTKLIADLEKRTGVQIVRIEIGKVDLLRDTAVIKVHFDGDSQPGHFESQGGN